MFDASQTFYLISQGNLFEDSTQVHHLGLKLNVLLYPVTQLTILVHLTFIILFNPIQVLLFFLNMQLLLRQKLILLLVLCDKSLIKSQVILSPVLQFLDLLHLLPQVDPGVLH